MFSLTRPKLAVYTHLVLLGSETVPPITLEELVAETRQTYEGPLVVGEDSYQRFLGVMAACTKVQLARKQ